MSVQEGFWVVEVNKVDLNKSANLIILFDIFGRLLHKFIDLFVKLLDLFILLCGSSIFIYILEWLDLLYDLSYTIQHFLFDLDVIPDPLNIYFP